MNWGVGGSKGGQAVNELQISDEFKNLIPPLNNEEFKQLETNILNEGIRDSLVVWNNTLIDGHNRYKIAKKHNLNYETTSLNFETKEEVINWIIDNQLGRRNITTQQRDYLLGLRYKAEKKSEPFKGNQYTQSGERQFVEHQKTSEKIGKQHGVSSRTVERAEKFADGLDNISKVEPEMKQEILHGKSEFTKQEVSSFADIEEEEEIKQKIAEMKERKVHVSNNSGNNEWYTPPKYLKIARKIMGSIDLDPASNEFANKNVKAKTFYTKEDNGLVKEWFGNVWLNPPYSQPLIQQFSEKLVEEIKTGNVNKACVLVNNATETRWMQMLLKECDYVWFPSGRIKYLNYKSEPANTPLQGQAFLIFNAEPTDNLDGVVLKNDKHNT